MLWKQRTMNRAGRLLACLLLTVIMAAGAASPARGAAGQSVNASGNLNLAPAVDPIGQDAKYTAVLYNNPNGLPTSDANAIAETGDGFIWIGSYAGLIRYDGNTFERMDSTNGITSVTCLFVDSRDRLWIGTNANGFAVMERGEYRVWDRRDGLKSTSVRAFAEDGNGRTYVATTSGIAVLDADMNMAMLTDPKLESAYIRDIRPGGDGLVYGLTQPGDLFSLRDGKMEAFLSRDECSIRDVVGILPDLDHPGDLYLGTSDSSVCHGSFKDNFAAPVIMDVAPLSYVERMEYIDGQLWLCADNGIGKITADGFCRLDHLPMNNSITHVMTDYEGNLWFTSTRQGVMKVVPNQFLDVFERYGLPEAVVNATCLLDNRLFVATDSGLMVIDDGKKLDRLPLAEAVTASGAGLGADDLLAYLDGVRIRSIIRDSKDRLWIATWQKYGLICYDHGKITSYTMDDGLFSDRVRVVYERSDGAVAVANTGGVCVLKDGKVTESYGAEAGIENREILTVTEGVNGDMILGSDGGGIYIIGRDGTRHIGVDDGLGSEVIMRVKRDPYRDVFWVVTTNSLAYMDTDYKVTTIKNFPYPNNYDLYENSRGDVWILSGSGIYVVPAEELLANGSLSPVFYSHDNGLTCTATANSYSELTAEGDLYIAATKGVAYVNIENSFENVKDLKMMVPYVEADGKRVWPDGDGGFTVPSDTRKLIISGFVISYALQNPKVSYCLEGFDTEPVTVHRSDLKPVDYSNLRGGEYRFVLRVEDEDANGGQELSVLIRKEKAIHEELWFWILVGLAVLLIDIWLIRLMLKRQARRIERKKDQERIAGDLRLASDIQASTLPRDCPLTGEGRKFDLHASMTPAKEVGGDFYDYFLIDNDHLAMVIADVSGKGIPAALFMMVAKALIKTQLMTGLTPAEALTNVNLQLCGNNDANMFVTVWAAVIELSTGRGLACNAGHENPALRRAGGAFEMLKYPHDRFVGAVKKARYQNREFELHPGECIFVYTDGVAEAADEAEKMFGEERLAEVLNQYPDAEPEALVRHVRDALNRFAGSVEQFDDITMLCMKYYGPQKQTDC